MQRRAVIGLIGSTSIGLVGCVADEPSPGSGATDVNNTKQTPTVDIIKEKFEVRGTECGSGENKATISHEPIGSMSGRVTVEGSISGNNSCYNARLESITYDNTQLCVSVSAYLPEANQDTICAECIVDIDYRTVLRYNGVSGIGVAVMHNSEHVRTSGTFFAEDPD
jgi:hypothetical protein